MCKGLCVCMCVCVSLCVNLCFISLGYILKSGITGSESKYINVYICEKLPDHFSVVYFTHINSLWEFQWFHIHLKILIF